MILISIKTPSWISYSISANKSSKILRTGPLKNLVKSIQANDLKEKTIKSRIGSPLDKIVSHGLAPQELHVKIQCALNPKSCSHSQSEGSERLLSGGLTVGVYAAQFL